MHRYGVVPDGFLPYSDFAAFFFLADFAHCLRGLRSIEEIDYTWDHKIPPMRYRNMLRQLGFNDKISEDTWETIGAYWSGGSGAHYGLGMMTLALERAHITPSTLQLSVEMDSRYSFLTLAAPPTLARVCRRVG